MTKLKTYDGRTIDALAVAVHDMILTAVKRLDMLHDESLAWLRDRLVDNMHECATTADQIHLGIAFGALAQACIDVSGQPVNGAIVLELKTQIAALIVRADHAEWDARRSNGPKPASTCRECNGRGLVSDGFKLVDPCPLGCPERASGW